MSKVITLRYSASCRDCGATLPAGTKARWYGKGRIYGLSCHDSDGGSRRVGQSLDGYEPLGMTPSRLDPYGVYSIDGRKLGSTCGCEDYPCCGH